MTDRPPYLASYFSCGVDTIPLIAQVHVSRFGLRELCFTSKGWGSVPPHREWSEKENSPPHVPLNILPCTAARGTQSTAGSETIEIWFMIWNSPFTAIPTRHAPSYNKAFFSTTHHTRLYTPRDIGEIQANSGNWSQFRKKNSWNFHNWPLYERSLFTTTFWWKIHEKMLEIIRDIRNYNYFAFSAKVHTF